MTESKDDKLIDRWLQRGSQFSLIIGGVPVAIVLALYLFGFLDLGQVLDNSSKGKVLKDALTELDVGNQKSEEISSKSNYASTDEKVLEENPHLVEDKNVEEEYLIVPRKIANNCHEKSVGIFPDTIKYHFPEESHELLILEFNEMRILEFNRTGLEIWKTYTQCDSTIATICPSSEVQIRVTPGDSLAKSLFNIELIDDAKTLAYEEYFDPGC